MKYLWECLFVFTALFLVSPAFSETFFICNSTAQIGPLDLSNPVRVQEVVELILAKDSVPTELVEFLPNLTDSNFTVKIQRQIPVPKDASPLRLRLEARNQTQALIRLLNVIPSYSEDYKNAKIQTFSLNHCTF